MYRESAESVDALAITITQCDGECQWQLYKRWRPKTADFGQVSAHRCAACRCWSVTLGTGKEAEEMALDSEVVVSELGVIGPAFLEQRTEKTEDPKRVVDWTSAAISACVSVAATAVSWLVWWLA